MATIQFGNGMKVQFEGNPTQQDVEEVANNLGINKIAPATPTAFTPPKEEGFLKSVARGIATPFAKFGVTAVNLGESVGRLATGDVEGANRAIKKERDVPFLGKTKGAISLENGGGMDKQFFKDITGTGAEIASTLAGGGGVKAAGKEVLEQTAKQTLKQLAKKEAIMGLKTGLFGGGASSFGQSIQEKDATAGSVFGDTVKGAAIGGTTGSILGATVPTVFGGIKNKLASRATQRAEEAAMIANKTPDARVADKMLRDGAVVTDKAAREVIRQGVPEADVALIKGGSAKDKIKMARMLEIRQSQMTNKRVTDRATDVVGDTFIKRIVEPLQKKNKQAAQQLNKVAHGLQGKSADMTPAVTQLSADLESAGITVGRGGNLNFKNSDFEGLIAPQTAIRNVWKRALRLAKNGDALQAHRTKSYIDEIVDYGKAAEGLSKRAQRILKSFRHNVDGVLDANFSDYNKANTVFADTIGELHKIAESMGKRFKVGSEFADASAGTTLRRILSNTKSRSDLLQLLESSQRVAKKYGAKIDEDIVTQANFADILEKMIGSEAPTSFLGQIERGIGGAQQAVSAGEDIMRGKLVSGTIKAGKYAIDLTRGISQESKIKALKALLRAEAEAQGVRPATVFGKNLLGTSIENIKIAPELQIFAKKARKYKSAEEFVASNINTYHGSPNADIINKEGFSLKNLGKGSGYKGVYGQGVTLTTDPARAALYGKVVETGIDTSKLKLFKPKDIIADIFSSATNHGDPAKITEYFTSKGYDGIQVGDEIVVFNPKNVQTKSQLTDLYNQATKKTKPTTTVFGRKAARR